MANGGKRAGSGRKPKEATLLKRKLIEHGLQEAEYAFSLICTWMHDKNQTEAFRLACADRVMDRVLGKPNQPLDVYDWRKEARADGYDPQSIFNQLVRAAQAQMAGDGDRGGVAGSQAEHGHDG